MMKKILLITALFLFLFQGIVLAGFKVYIKPDFSHQIPFDVDKGEVVKGVITVKNRNDFTIKGEAESSVAWASIDPKDFSISPANEIILDYTINAPTQEGVMEGDFKIIEWADESTGGVGMTGKYSTVVPFTLQVQAVGPETTTQPTRAEPKYLLPTSFILAIVLIIIACIIVLILWLSREKKEIY